MVIERREVERKLGDDERYEYLELRRGEPLAEAGPSAGAKGQVRVELGSSVGEACRVELLGIRTPQLGVEVHCGDRDVDVDAFWDVHTPELEFLKGHP